MENDFPYNDIIDLPHHVSDTRPHMPVADRAAQFSPFAALTGYDDVIDEVSRVTQTRSQRFDNENEQLDFCLRRLRLHISRRPTVTVTYFCPDALKSGGEYLTVTIKAKAIDEYTRMLVAEDGTQIPIDDITALADAQDE